MNAIGPLHLLAALTALASGFFILWRPKGTLTHRRVGWIYVISMLVLNVTALLIYRLTGMFGPFHIAAMISLATLVAGVIPVLRRRPAKTWVEYHYFFMAYSYLGLVAAAVAETSTRVLGPRAFSGRPTPLFWVLVAAATIAVFIVGSRLIKGRAMTILEPFRRPDSLSPGQS